jgi:ABC-type spermidine/putrescine transport system permease subunit II
VKWPWILFAGWALLLGISLTVLWGIGLGPIHGWLPVAMFAAAILTTLAMAALAARGDRRQGAEGDRSSEARAIPDFSFPTVLAGIAVATVGLGLELGPWLILIGAGALAVAVGWLAIELRATRRAARLAAGEEGTP